MTDGAVQQIAEYNERRHNHFDESAVSRCKHCGSFVDKGEPEQGRVRYTCGACNHAILEYTGQRQATRP